MWRFSDKSHGTRPRLLEQTVRPGVCSSFVNGFRISIPARLVFSSEASDEEDRMVFRAVQSTADYRNHPVHRRRRGSRHSIDDSGCSCRAKSDCPRPGAGYVDDHSDWVYASPERGPRWTHREHHGLRFYCNRAKVSAGRTGIPSLDLQGLELRSVGVQSEFVITIVVMASSKGWIHTG